MSTNASSATTGSWVATWAGPIARHPEPREPIGNQTVRLRVEASVGGRAVRVVLTNEYGTKVLYVGAASVTTVDEQGVEGEPKTLTFGGQKDIEIAVGAIALSDHVEVDVAPGQTLFVKLFLPRETVPESAVLLQGGLPETHPLYFAQPEWSRVDVSAEGDHTGSSGLPGAVPLTHMPFLSRVDVLAQPNVGAVAVLGTTYTDGLGVWPDYLSRRLNTEKGKESHAIINLSARGGSLSRGHAPSGREGVVTLFDREVLTLPGLTHVIVSEARQDIATSGTRSLNADGSVAEADADPTGASPVTAEILKAAYRQLIARGHANGVKVLAATMPPFRGVPAPGYYNEDKEATREELNRWILDSGEFDGVIDIDGIVRDPADTHQYREEFRSLNLFGPSPAGHAAIADSIDTAIFG
ncbi:GDSL-type esterase/lipase family protein [Williamsia soli]|uniref:GDSL-type esterase/lipase family protein n=1 Tax=Williamsia soli TaxID=364929 RepID=UPI001A9FA343|nr:GDSL-type esterase/lipase family protein [Williamsia soli]